VGRRGRSSPFLKGKTSRLKEPKTEDSRVTLRLSHGTVKNQQESELEESWRVSLEPRAGSCRMEAKLTGEVELLGWKPPSAEQCGSISVGQRASLPRRTGNQKATCVANTSPRSMA
jgi:hypothetical protein